MTESEFIVATIRGEADAAAPDTVDGPPVAWWSFTKTALAAAALALVARGLCELDAPIDARGVTLRLLLQHRAGVPNYGALPAYHDAVRRGDTPWSAAEFLRRVDAGRPDFPPGQGWRYSNVGYLLVSQMIEERSGRELGAALAELVFDPLGLVSPRLARVAGDLDATAWGNDASYDPRWVAHGLLVGTPGDAARLLHRLLAGALLPPPLLTQMTLAHPLDFGRLAGRPWETTGYGLGLMIGMMDGVGLATGHSGGGPGSVAAVYRFDRAGTPTTIAVFARGDQEGRCETEAARLAATG